MSAASHPADRDLEITVSVTGAEYIALADLSARLRMTADDLIRRTIVSLVAVSDAVQPASERLQS